MKVWVGDGFLTKIGVDASTTGTFELSPGDATVAVNERLNYAFTWTVPEPLNWHDLQFLQLRIRGGEDNSNESA